MSLLETTCSFDIAVLYELFMQTFFIFTIGPAQLVLTFKDYNFISCTASIREGGQQRRSALTERHAGLGAHQQATEALLFSANKNYF